MFSDLTTTSFIGKRKIKDGICFNSIVNGNKITFSVYNSNQMLLYESFNSLDDLRNTILKESQTPRGQFYKNLVCFLCDIDASNQSYSINESADETNNSLVSLQNNQFAQPTNTLPSSNDNISLNKETNNPNIKSSSSNTSDASSNIASNDYGILDNILAGNQDDYNSVMKPQLMPNVPKIYAFITNDVQDAVKIGFTAKTAARRLAQWQEKYKDAELIGWWPATLLVNDVKSYFKDFPVHAETIERGFANLARNDFNKNVYFSQEFFRKKSSKNDKEELKNEVISNIIDDVKDEILHHTHGKNYTSYNLLDNTKPKEQEPNEFSFKNTPLQQEAIDEGIRIYNSGTNKMLLAAVMRFGKTHVAYSIAKGVGATFVLVSSAKANTRDEWRKGIYHEDFRNAIFVEFEGDSSTVIVSDRMKHEYKQPYEIVNFKSNFQAWREQKRMIIIFATLQDLSGKTNKPAKPTNDIIESYEQEYISYLLEAFASPRQQKSKHDIIFNTENDLFVIDETHYGARGGVYGKVSMDNKEIVPEEDEGKDDIEDMSDTEHNNIKKYVRKIPSRCQLHLSGTPYQIMTTGEFDESQIIGRYSYTDMIEARDKWIDDNVTGDDEDPDYRGPKESDSPFFGIPNVIRFGMKLTNRCRKALAQQERENNLNSKLSYLFSTVKGENKFVFEDAIKELGRAIFGGDKICGFLQEDNITRGEIFKHIVAVLPSVKACHAFAKLLQDNNLIDKDREIIIAVENDVTGPMTKCAETVDGLNAYLKNLETHGKKSLTLTCVRLLTGASVPLWDSMLHMKDTDSAQEYDQAVFRICTRNIGTIQTENGPEKINLKPHVYLIDFKVDRMFKIIADSAQAIADVKRQRGLDSFKDNVKRELKKLPIYVEWGTEKMKELNPTDFMKYYTSYNKNSSVDDIISNGIKKFDITKLDKLHDILSKFDPRRINRTNTVPGSNDKGQDDVNFKTPDQTVVDGNGDLVSKRNLSRDKKKDEETRERLVSLLKNLLYLVICLDGKIESLDNLIEILKKDEDKRKVAKIFLKDETDPVKVLEKLSNDLDVVALNEVDAEIRNVNNLLNDETLSKEERMMTAIKKLGKLDKSEVVTPSAVARRMIEKLDDDFYKNAEHILEVNSKTGEFIVELYKKYGVEVAKKVDIIPSSEMTKQFIKKILSILGIPEYNLLNIISKDFLKVKMTNDK